MSLGSTFREIEHKFIVGPDFDLADFMRRAELLAPSGTTAVQGLDTYFVTAKNPEYLFRHRFDDERQELTVKSRSGGDTEVRLEANLKLDLRAGNQREAVAAFLRPLKIIWQGAVCKDIKVYYYPDCEVVYYVAHTPEQPEHKVHCIEVESIGARDVDSARATLVSYEERLGVTKILRSKQSLFDLLLLPAMNAQMS